jgi:hypothetical protein
MRLAVFVYCGSDRACGLEAPVILVLRQLYGPDGLPGRGLVPPCAGIRSLVKT